MWEKVTVKRILKSGGQSVNVEISKSVERYNLSMFIIFETSTKKAVIRCLYIMMETITPTPHRRKEQLLHSPLQPRIHYIPDTLVEEFNMDRTTTSSPATSDATSPATSTFSSSGEINLSAGTPVTSPMEPNINRKFTQNSTSKNRDRKHSTFASPLKLADYVSGEEKDWDIMSDTDAPSLEENPTQDMLNQLRNMGFRETIARAATDACDEVSVAVQYACDHPMLKNEQSLSPSNMPSMKVGGRGNDYSSKMQDSPLEQKLYHDAVRSWKLPPSSSSSDASVPRSSSTSTELSTSSTATCSTTTCSPSSFPKTDRQHELANHLLAIGFQHYQVNAAVKRCNSTPAATRFILDGGVKGWNQKMADVVFECAICLSDDLDETEMVTLDCDHRFCRKCMKYHLDSFVKSHKIKENEMICPVPRCCSTISLSIIQNIISKVDYDKLLELKLHKEYAANNADVRTCPKCSFMVIIEEPVEETKQDTERPNIEGKVLEEQHQAEVKRRDNGYAGTRARRRTNRHRKGTQNRDVKGMKKRATKTKENEMSKASKRIQKLLDCLECMNPECKHTFCGRCGLAPHHRQKDLDVSCQDYAAFCEANDASNEIFEEYLKEQKMKRCPKCLLPAELKSGCHFIRCVCKSNYCYLCGRGLDEKSHYSHFHKGPYGKRCFGGAKDKKGYVAQPACLTCTGKDCLVCSTNVEVAKKEKLSKIVAKRERDAARGGMFGWFNKKFGKK